MRVPEKTRNEQIFTACLDEAKKYTAVAAAHGLTGSRVEQIFLAEAKLRYPAIFSTVAGGHGFRTRFLERLRAQGAAA